MNSTFGPFNSPVKLPPQKQSEYEKEFLSPEMNENFSFPLGTYHSVRAETLTPGPIYYPGDSHNRRTPGIDRPTQMRSLGAFEHSADLEGKNELLRKSNLIEESPYPDTEYDVEIIKLPEPILGLQPFQSIQDQSRDEYVSPGKNPHSQPFFPQNQYSIHESFGGSRLDLPERVPPLPRGSQYPARIAPDSHPQSYPLQSFIESRHYPGLSFSIFQLFDFLDRSYEQNA
jgi:hypothetical protein